MIPKMCYVFVLGEDDKASKGGQVQPGDGDEAADTRRGARAESG